RRTSLAKWQGTKGELSDHGCTPSAKRRASHPKHRTFSREIDPFPPILIGGRRGGRVCEVQRDELSQGKWLQSLTCRRIRPSADTKQLTGTKASAPREWRWFWSTKHPPMSRLGQRSAYAGWCINSRPTFV